MRLQIYHEVKNQLERMKKANKAVNDSFSSACYIPVRAEENSSDDDYE
jgi:hypothetical protein